MSKISSKRKKVTFSLEATKAETVVLMADFNNWDPNKHQMKNNGNGLWTKSVMLTPGEYEYKYLVDGKWHENLQSEKTCQNCYGTYNGLLRIED